MPAVKNIGEPPRQREPHARIDAAARGHQTSRGSTRCEVQAPLAEPTTRTSKRTRTWCADLAQWLGGRG
jgi:hypothetical protein